MQSEQWRELTGRSAADGTAERLARASGAVEPRRSPWPLRWRVSVLNEHGAGHRPRTRNRPHRLLPPSGESPSRTLCSAAVIIVVLYHATASTASVDPPRCPASPPRRRPAVTRARRRHPARAFHNYPEKTTPPFVEGLRWSTVVHDGEIQKNQERGNKEWISSLYCFSTSPLPLASSVV